MIIRTKHDYLRVRMAAIKGKLNELAFNLTRYKIRLIMY